MKKVMITGASSFIGRRLAGRFLRAQWQVIAVVRSEESASRLPDGVQTVICGMQDYGTIGRYGDGCDCFVHLAWEGTRGSSRMDAELQERNMICSLQAVRSMIAAGCKRVVLAGSQAEYGPCSGIISETMECAPVCEYGKAKLELCRKAAKLCRSAQIAFKEPRIFSLYGPGDFSGTMIMQVLGNMLTSRECLLTKGVQMWDFLYIDDAIEALYCLCNDECPDGVYNLGSGDVRPLRAYIEEMAQLTETKSDLRFGAVSYPKTGMVSLWPDVSKIRNALGWVPQVSFADGIRRLLNCMNGEKAQ